MNYKDLKNATDEELAKLHDERDAGAWGDAKYFLEELRHREIMRVLHSIAGVVEHVAHMSLCADIVANHDLAKWKNEHSLGHAEKPPHEYITDPRIKVS